MMGFRPSRVWNRGEDLLKGSLLVALIAFGLVSTLAYALMKRLRDLVKGG